QRFPIRVRYAPEYRSHPAAIGSVLVTAPNGTQVPLAQLADIRPVAGPSMISSENGLLVVTVLLNVRGRDVGSFVEQARRVVRERVRLPEGSYIVWRGQKRDALGGRLTHAALLEAVTEGALLRLRPKVMTVSTVVTSLLPIMWSHSTGAEVMKPLATPVLGGMVSSLGLVLIVTPVMFSWLRERELRRAEMSEGAEDRSGTRPAPADVGGTAVRQQ